MKAEAVQKTACYHCGEVCNNKNVSLKDKFFYFKGCKFVLSPYYLY